MTTDPLEAAGIEVEWQGDVAVVHWRSGENRFNRTSVTGLGTALDRIEAARPLDQPLAVVVTGDGKFFSNGLDLDWMATAGDDAATLVSDVHHLFARVLLFPAVV